MSPSRRRNLVLLRAGDASLHRGWLAGDEPDFDILISYYGSHPDRHREDADEYEMRAGPKWAGLADLLAERSDLLERYELFWCPDDDLEATAATVNRMFALVRAFDLALAQPALTRDSFHSWRILLQRTEYVLRHVAFVEVMAPLFTRESLRTCLPTFRESRSGWGLDWVWPSLVARDRPEAIAVLDETPVRHTRPIGGGDLYRNHPELDPRREMEELVARYGVSDARPDAKYRFHGGVARVEAGRWERLGSRLRAWNARRRLRRRNGPLA